MELEVVQSIVNRSGVLGPVRRAAFLGEGEFTWAWRINDIWVCRFPKHRDAADSLRREACLLPQIACRLPLAIPQPVCHSLAEKPYLVAIHELVAGQELTRDLFESLDGTGRDRCAGQVACFLSCFHQVDPALAQSCGIKRADYQSRYREVQECAAEYLEPRLSSLDSAYVGRLLKEFLAAEIPDPQNYALLHGDVSPDHVLWNPLQTQVSGILDFGDMEIGDVAWDLVYLWKDYGSEFLRIFLRHFSNPDVESLLRRAYRFSELDAIEWAANVCAGRREGSPEEFLSSISRLRAGEHEPPWRELL